MKSTEKLGLPLPEKTRKFLNDSSQRIKKNITSPKVKNLNYAYFELYKAEKSLWKRHALSLAYALANEPVILLDDELLVGIHYQEAGAPENKEMIDAWNEEGSIAYFENRYGYAGIRKRIEEEIPEILDLIRTGHAEVWLGDADCSSGHIGWRWNWIVDAGITGMLERIDKAFNQADDTGKECLECMKICLNAVLDWNDRHIDELENKLASATGPEKNRILEKIEICRQVPRQGARNFREAIQAFHFSYLATMFENPAGGNGPGRLDYYLWPYLEKDLKTGVENPESARMLIDELFIRFHERMLYGRDGHVETIVVGGCHPDGCHSVSPLSEIMVESIAGLKISHPSVYIRMPENAPESFVKLAARDLCEGGNRSQIVSDKAIIEAMTLDKHISLEDARMYMCGGCMEISPHGMNGDLLFSGFFNVLKVFEIVMTGGRNPINNEPMFKHLTRDLTDFASFDDFFDAFAAELRRSLNLTFKLMDITCEEWAERRPQFLVSSQVEDCIARGRGINNGGARYEDYGSTPIGLPNVADSLFAIKKAVFENKIVGADELLKALRADFSGYYLLHNRLKKIPQYGQGDSEADEMMARVVRTTCDIYEDYTNRLNGKIKPMIMTFMVAPRAGRVVGATPDGRLSQKPVAQGITPQNSAMTKGITAAMLSQSVIGLNRFSGGASSMWDLDVQAATTDNVIPLLKTFLSLGGQMYQGNTTDVRELLAAQKQPDQYQNLLVRIGGYSGRFVTLDENLQNEIIHRTRHLGPGTF